MSLADKLEKAAKELERERWDGHMRYQSEVVEQSELLLEAAKRIRELEAKCPT